MHQEVELVVEHRMTRRVSQYRVELLGLETRENVPRCASTRVESQTSVVDRGKCLHGWVDGQVR